MSVFTKLDEEGRRIDRQAGLRSPRIKSIAPEGREPIEQVEAIEETAGEAGRRERRRLIRGGRRSTILSGIMSSLKKRLGE